MIVLIIPYMDRFSSKGDTVLSIDVKIRLVNGLMLDKELIVYYIHMMELIGFN